MGKQQRRVGGVALYVRECFYCLQLNDGGNSIEYLWVRIREKANKANIMVEFCWTTQPGKRGRRNIL